MIPPDLKEIKRLYLEEELHLREVGKIVGVSGQTVLNHLKKAGVQLRPRGLMRVSIDRDVIDQLYIREQLSIDKVAERLSVSSGKVAYAKRRHGIPSRSRGNRRKKYPELAKLAVGEHIEVVRGPRPKPHDTFYDMASRVGIRVSIKRVGENAYRLTRVK